VGAPSTWAPTRRSRRPAIAARTITQSLPATAVNRASGWPATTKSPDPHAQSRPPAVAATVGARALDPPLPPPSARSLDSLKPAPMLARSSSDARRARCRSILRCRWVSKPPVVAFVVALSATRSAPSDGEGARQATRSQSRPDGEPQFLTEGDRLFSAPR